MHLSNVALLATAFGTSVFGMPNVNVEAGHHLERRALPPCPKCPVSDGDWLSKFTRDDYGTLEDQSTTYEPGWLPQVCSVHGYTCYDLGPGIKFRAGGINEPLGTWKRSDDSQVMAWQYWQSTLQFVGAEATVNSYPAHCTIYTLVKGSAARVSLDGEEVLPNGNTLDKCFGSADDIDIGVQRIYLA